MLVTKRTPYTLIDLWYPRYKNKWKPDGEKEYLPAVYRVVGGKEIIVIEFSKAKHLAGLRFAMKREDIMKYPQQSNGRIMCYAVPESKWEPVETANDIIKIVEELWPSQTH